MDPYFGTHLAVSSNGAAEDFGTEGTSLGGGSAEGRAIKASYLDSPEPPFKLVVTVGLGHLVKRMSDQSADDR
jgi:hypothetical protein